MGLREEIEALCLDRLGRKPDLENPIGFNDKIQWLKLYDQRKAHITACDKWAVRKTVPRENLVPARLGAALNKLPAVVKCSHDCGSIQKIFKPLDFDSKAIRRAKGRKYGDGKGEWAYRFIKPRIITERMLAPEVTDYKFHCSEGKVRWVQIISERGHEEGARETILWPDGKPSGLHMDQNMRHAPDDPAYPGDTAWKALRGLAERLARPWRYVRVDLYWVKDRAWFGELTFWPLAGCYTTDDEPKFGGLLVMDTKTRFRPIVR